MFVLELLGALSLGNDARTVPVSAQQKRSLGLLAILGLGGRQGISRDRVESYLWPESASALARHSLDQTVYSIRHALGSDFILSAGRELRLNPELVVVDAWEFDTAVHGQQWAAAAGHYKGPLLHGFHFVESRELESWVDTERARLLREYQTALGYLAKTAAEAGDHAQSVEWLRKLASSDPLSSGATKKLMLALGAAGDRAGAVKHARLYQELVRQQLEIEPDAEIEKLALTLSQPTNAERMPARAQAPNNPQDTPSAAYAGEEGKRSGRPEKTLLYAAVALASLMSIAAIWGWMRPEPSRPVVRYTLAVDSADAIARGSSWTGRVALSPDGGRLAYIGGSSSQLLIRPRSQLRAVAVAGTEGVKTPFFSPDGSGIGFLKDNKVQITWGIAGLPITVTDTLTGVAGASWGPDGFIYVDGQGPTSLLRVEAKQGSRPRWFTALDTASGEFDHTWPDVLPNGKGVLFTVSFNARNGVKGAISYAIAVADIPSGRHRVIVDDAKYVRYASSGHLLYVTPNKILMIAPFDQRSMKVTGQPTALIQGMRIGPYGSADLAVSATGTLVYSTGGTEGNYELVWVARDGRAQPLDAGWRSGWIGFPTVSPDGVWLAVARRATAESMNIWIKRLDKGPSIKLTLDGQLNVGPEWTPDGKSVTFASEHDVGGKPFQLWTTRADGSAPAVLQFREKRHVYSPRWSRDGKWLIFQTDHAQAGAGDLLGIQPGVDTIPVPLVATRFTEAAPALSPDGRWLAYQSNESGGYEIYVVPFPNTTAAKWAISSGGGTEPLWSHRGSELFYRDRSGNLVTVELKTTPAFSINRSTALFSAVEYNSYEYAPQYAVGPDDQRFIMIRPVETKIPDNLVVVENWFAELNTKSRK
jgi:serine/threonine-protein kinase